MSQGRALPAFSSDIAEQAIEFCTEVIDASGVAERLEALVAKATGRPRQLKVRAVLVALFVLALDDRPLHLKAATRLLFCRFPPLWRHRPGITGEAATKKAFLARYRQVRYLFHVATSVVDPSVQAKKQGYPWTTVGRPGQGAHRRRDRRPPPETGGRDKRPRRGVGAGVLQR